MVLRVKGKRRLKTSPGYEIRPTSARVRKSLFDIIQNGVENSRWLDLCCGVGAIGAEAISRDARRVVGIDNSSYACRLTEENWNKMDPEKNTFRIVKSDVRRYLKDASNRETFDFIYFDPPYDAKLYNEVIGLLPRFIDTNGLIIVEHPVGFSPLLPGRLELADLRHYRKTSLSFIIKA